MGLSFLQHAQLEIVILYIVLTTQGVILLLPELYNNIGQYSVVQPVPALYITIPFE